MPIGPIGPCTLGRWPHAIGAMVAEEAVDFGIIDEVVQVRDDSTLNLDIFEAANTAGGVAY